VTKAVLVVCVGMMGENTHQVCVDGIFP